MADVETVATETQTEPPPSQSPEPSQDQQSNETLAENVSADDPPQAVPATWPEEWRQNLSSDPEDLKTLNRYKDPGNVWKAYKSLRQRVSAGELKPSKPDGTDEEAMAEWRKTVGLPESHEGYLEGMELPEDIQPVAKVYAERMFQDGASKDEVQRGINIYMEEMAKAEEARFEADQTYRQQSEDQLRSEWGPEYRANLNAMHGLLEQYGDDGLKEALFTARMEDGSMLGDNPAVIKFLVDAAREINPFGVVAPNAGMDQKATIKERIAELQAEMGDAKGRQPGGYWHSPSKQAEYTRLLELEERANR